MAYPAGYWAELVRSTGSTQVVESTAGNFIWLRTSDGEPLEQQYDAGIGGAVNWIDQFADTTEPDWVGHVTSGVWVTGIVGYRDIRIRFRKAGEAWLPSNNGISSLTSVPWNGASTYRFFTQPSVPEKPTSFSVTAAGQAFRLQASVDNGGSAVTKWQYKVATTSAGLSSASWTDIPSSASDDLDWTTGNIGYATTRHFQVRAVNAEGNGAASDADSATTGAAPVTNVAPSFSPSSGAAQSWTAGTAITNITVPAATGTPAPTYSATGLPAGVSFNASTRVISGTPTTAGTGTITVTATNSEGTDTYTIAWTVVSPLPNADAPSVSIDAIVSGLEGTTVDLSATLSGGTYDTLTYAWSVTGGTLSSATAASPTWTRPTVSSDTAYTISLTVTASGTGTNAKAGTTDTESDSEGATVQDSVTPTLSVSISGDTTRTNGQTASYTATVGGTATGTIAYQWQSFDGTSWSNISGETGSTYDHTRATAGSVTVRCRVTRGGLSANSNSITTTWSAAPPTPTVTVSVSVDDAAPTNGDTVTFTATVGGTATGTIAYQWQQLSGSSWGNISGETGSTYDHTRSSAGTVTVRCRATREGVTATSAQASATWSAAPPPDPVVTTDTDSIYILGTTAPGTPSGGTNAENHLPSGWSRTEPDPTATENVYRSQRTRTFTDGAFTSATAWGAPAKIADASPLPTAPLQVSLAAARYIGRTSRASAPGWYNVRLSDAIPANWAAGSSALDVNRVAVTRSGSSYRLQLLLSGRLNSDAEGGTVTLAFGSTSVTIDMAAGLSSGLYALSTTAAVYNAMAAGNGGQAGTLTFALDSHDAEAPTLAITDRSTVAEGGTLSFTATPSGGKYDDISYAWSVVSGGGTISGSGASATYTAPQVSSDTAVRIRCVATVEGDGTNATPGTSDTVTADETFTVTDTTVTPPPTPTVSAVASGPATRASGQAATYTVNVGGTATGTITYQWQWRQGTSGAWTDTDTTASLTEPGFNGQTFQYRVVVTRQGVSATSNIITTVWDASPTDTTAPTVSTRTVNGASLVITCSEALDTNSVPAASAFAVQVAGAARTVSAVAIAGSTITLTLASAVTAGQAVTVAYTKPSANPVQDAAGNDLATFAAASVTNNTPGQLELLSAAIDQTDRTRVVLTFNRTLDGFVPQPSDFTLTAGGTAVAVSSVARSGAALTLTLASAVTAGDAVTVSYAPPIATLAKYSRGSTTTGSTLAQFRARTVEANRDTSYTSPDPITTELSPPNEENYILKFVFAARTQDVWTALRLRVSGGALDDAVAFFLTEPDGGDEIGVVRADSFAPSGVNVTANVSAANWPAASADGYRYFDIEVYFTELSGGQRLDAELGYTPTGKAAVAPDHVDESSAYLSARPLAFGAPLTPIVDFTVANAAAPTLTVSVSASGSTPTNGDTVTFTATVGGTATGTVAYQWQSFDGTSWNNISGETGSTYDHTRATAGTVTVRCRVTRQSVTATSAQASATWSAPAPVITTDTDSIWQLAASDPGAPSGGTSSENHTPTGWTRTEPDPTTTEGVWRSQRTRTFTDGAFTSATAWGDPTETAPALPQNSDTLTLIAAALRNRNGPEWDYYARNDDPALDASLTPGNTTRVLSRCRLFRGGGTLTATTSRQFILDFEGSATQSRGTGDDLTAQFEQHGSVVLTLADGKTLTLGSPASAGDVTDHYAWTVDDDETEFDYADFDAAYDALVASISAGTPLSATLLVRDFTPPEGADVHFDGTSLDAAATGISDLGVQGVPDLHFAATALDVAVTGVSELTVGVRQNIHFDGTALDAVVTGFSLLSSQQIHFDATALDAAVTGITELSRQAPPTRTASAVTIRLERQSARIYQSRTGQSLAIDSLLETHTNLLSSLLRATIGGSAGSRWLEIDVLAFSADFSTNVDFTEEVEQNWKVAFVYTSAGLDIDVFNLPFTDFSDPYRWDITDDQYDEILPLLSADNPRLIFDLAAEEIHFAATALDAVVTGISELANILGVYFDATALDGAVTGISVLGVQEVSDVHFDAAALDAAVSAVSDLNVILGVYFDATALDAAASGISDLGITEVPDVHFDGTVLDTAATGVSALANIPGAHFDATALDAVVTGESELELMTALDALPIDITMDPSGSGWNDTGTSLPAALFDPAAGVTGAQKLAFRRQGSSGSRRLRIRVVGGDYDFAPAIEDLGRFTIRNPDGDLLLDTGLGGDDDHPYNVPITDAQFGVLNAARQQTLSVRFYQQQEVFFDATTLDAVATGVSDLRVSAIPDVYFDATALDAAATGISDLAIILAVYFDATTLDVPVTGVSDLAARGPTAVHFAGTRLAATVTSETDLRIGATFDVHFPATSLDAVATGISDLRVLEVPDVHFAPSPLLVFVDGESDLLIAARPSAVWFAATAIDAVVSGASDLFVEESDILTWPDALPEVLSRDDFQIVPADRSHGFPVDEGPDLSRPRYSREETSYLGRMYLSDTQWDTLAFFYESTLNYGTASFYFLAPLDQEDFVIVRFVSRPTRRRSGGRWEVDMALRSAA